MFLALGLSYAMFFAKGLNLFVATRLGRIDVVNSPDLSEIVLNVMIGALETDTHNWFSNIYSGK